MKQETLYQEENEEKSSKRKGPPNRMNDLSYKEWMKFQKSFFRHTSTYSLIEEFVYFFTKAKWDNGRKSCSLMLGPEGFESANIASPRIVETMHTYSLDNIILNLDQVIENGNKYDFILLDLRPFIKNEKSLTEFVLYYSAKISSKIKQLLFPKMYGCILVGYGNDCFKSFPIPWSVALSFRKNLKLRDEKIGLIEDSHDLFYCLIFQADEDQRAPFLMTPDNLVTGNTDKDIPIWIFPKSPSRKPNEILHPAKFPETMIQKFINVFTKPGDNVFDPMVGTGSTVLAAAQCDRNGYGIDINPEFINIARSRLGSASQLSILGDISKTTNVLIQGDATRLEQIDELKELKFHYVITSPPYWSMLSNKGSEYQKARRQKKLPLVYSDDKNDIGNIDNYDEFLKVLENIYNLVAEKLVKEGYLTIIVKNVKREHVVYPIAWDLVAALCKPNGKYEYIGTTLWCQDDIGLKPFAVGIYWVSNTLHQYCLHFRKK